MTLQTIAALEQIPDFKASVTSLWRFTKPFMGGIFLRFLLGLVRIAASLSFVWVCKALVDIATGQRSDSFRVYVALMIGIMLVQYLNNLLASYWEGRMLVRVNTGMRADAFASVMGSLWNGRSQMHSGDAVNRLESDVSVVSDLVCSRFPDVLITVCQLVAASFYLLSMAPGLVWLLIALMAVAAIGSKLFFKKIRLLTLALRKKESEIQGYMQENILHRAVALTLAGLDRVLTSLGTLQDEVIQDTESRLRLGMLTRGFMSFGFAAGYASAFIWGVSGIRSGSVTFGMMTAFLQLVGQVQSPIANLSRHLPAFIHGLTSADRLRELMELPSEQYGTSVHIDATPSIVVRNISYCYPDSDKKILDNFSCEFKAGQITALRGETGSGKSTLMRLLLALLHPDDGEILLRCNDMDAPVSANTRCNFMYVPQGNSMMSGTVRGNFLMANPNATEQDMLDALETAEAGFVLKRPDGLDMRCSEEGGGLSEGQAQRLAIARALLHTGNILILDESTSALDPETERRLLEKLHARCHGHRTVVFVTHRETVSEWADSVVSLD